MAPPYTITSVPAMWVDHQGLKHLYEYCSRDGVRVALIGFNECSKHLVNMCGDSVVGIYDPAPNKQGISFRGKKVVADNEKLGATHLAVCDFLLAYDFAAHISTLYDNAIPVYCPPHLAGKSTEWIDPFTQERIYRDIFKQAADAPLTMMDHEKICFLLELLQNALSLPGDVIEMGVWQGGSAWYLAKALAWHGQTKHLYLVDQFESAQNSRTATVCNDEVRRYLSFYQNVTMLEGLVNDAKLLAKLADRKYCFAHYDLGLYEAPLKHLWDRLSVGAPLILDNYGHLAARPALFERFFAAQGARILRLPWSKQGLVFKHG